MSIQFSGSIDIGHAFNRLLNFVFGTLSSRLMTLGVGLMSFGMTDIIIYSIEAVVLKKTNVTPPGDTFGWLEGLGLFTFFVGLVIPLLTWILNSKNKILAGKTEFKEKFREFSDAKLQDEIERLYSIKNADIPSIKAILNHPYNVNKAISLFQSCQFNVVYQYPWFSLKDSLFKLRYNLGFIFWLLLPLYSLACLFMAMVEYIHPGISDSGPHAAIFFFAISMANLLGAALIMQDLKKMGTAITLVEKLNPANLSVHRPETAQKTKEDN